MGGNPPKFFIFDEITSRWPGKKVEKTIVDELHVNNVTRSVLDVDKNYRGFKISSQKDNCVNRNFTSILSKIRLFRYYFREPLIVDW